MMKHIFYSLFAVALTFGAQAQDAASATIKAGEYVIPIAKPWEGAQSQRPMRAGEMVYKQEGDGISDVEMVVYYFGPGQGGGAQANVDRWVGQFEGTPKSKTEEKEINGKKITVLEAEGTYMESAGGPFAGNKTAREDYIMLAAILPSPQGDVFFKLAAPAKSVKALKADFHKLIEATVGKKK